MKKHILISIGILIFILVGTVLAVSYAKGYRFRFANGKPELSGTGLLVATSTPNGASVLVNDRLLTATDNTITLLPGTYEVKIAKEGYLPWKKTIVVKKEEVSKIKALLFPTAPKLESITAAGVENPLLDPSETRIAYAVSSQSAQRNGLYVLDMTTHPILTLQSGITHIIDDTVDQFSRAQFTWSADGKDLIATSSSAFGSPVTYLLEADVFNQNPRRVSEPKSLDALFLIWQEEQEKKEQARLNSLKRSLRTIIADYFDIIAWSPDETKILYHASTSATLPLIIEPHLFGANSTPEKRTIEKGQIYAYDIKEDRNYAVPPTPLMWFPDSEHLMYVYDKRIDIMEYDGLNRTTIYAGPFIDNYVFPYPNGSKILILTNLNNPNIPPNLYTIGLK
ncbi:MAG: hypothetical protein A3J69_00020 [Candidatus Levybacteria bacterium RIFCSPHIGHO2_02_FULL_42_12]|nr:MAG: hypothetical protein A3J69_00020 [Candidatus Levybacteria bacterium RIFCSPHIGHO2_02_FULL_42_12]OGH43048.1 MAG: hypothetical protein A3B53_00715 [Candidatus Levybacteria bacterium RIFCSPLOWO2_01_FULL_42_15]